jgi:hypothetical protein
MADKHPKGTHNPSQASLQRWENEGGAIKGVRAKRPRDPNQLGKLIVDIAVGHEDREPPTDAEFVIRGRSRDCRAVKVDPSSTG